MKIIRALWIVCLALFFLLILPLSKPEQNKCDFLISEEVIIVNSALYVFILVWIWLILHLIV
jgi:hypothetical protein